MTAWAGVIATSQAGRLDPARRPAAIRISAGLTGAYTAVVALTASPFTVSDIPPVTGVGLQPVLEYPAMVWHPPILYAGLVGMIIPAIVATSGVAATSASNAAAEGTSVAVGSTQTLRVTTALLTLGLGTGALWANVELGWGGFWAWDPIENAGLVAWLAAMAALHGLSPADRAGRRAVGLALLPGVAALWATTLTRIGVIESVHAFADRPALRIGLLVVAAAASLGAVGCLFIAPTSTHDDGRNSRDGKYGAESADDPSTATTSAAAGRTNAVAVLAATTLLVSMGTYEPLVEAATTGDRVSIAGHFFTRLLWPVVIIGGGLAVRADRAWWPSLGGIAFGVLLTPFAAGPFGVVLGAAGGAVAGSIIGVWQRRGALAHLGIGLVIAGIAGTMAGSSVIVDAPTGTEVAAGNLAVIHRSIQLIDEPERSIGLATVEIDGVTFHPSLVSYPLRGASSSEIARGYNGLDERQVVLIDGDTDSARYRVSHLPRLVLVWLGALLIAFGLLFPIISINRLQLPE